MVSLCVCVDPYSPPVYRRHLGLGRSDEEDEVDRDSSRQSLRHSDSEGTLAESAS